MSVYNNGHRAYADFKSIKDTFKIWSKDMKNKLGAVINDPDEEAHALAEAFFMYLSQAQLAELGKRVVIDTSERSFE